MIITFEPLNESHFSLVLEWLEMHHVKKWFDHDIVYNIDLVRKKYASYAQGYKIVDGARKPIHCFIIYVDQKPIGYIQIYNAYDFPRSQSLLELPQNLAAMDMFIGKIDFLGQNIGSSAIKQFLEEYAFKNYRYVFVDPEYKNSYAVSAYEKAGFSTLKRVQNRFWMVARKKIVRLPVTDMVAIETLFQKHFLKDDRLWVFGSRADLAKRGGDIDLYVETHAKTANEAYDMKKNFIWDLECKIGEQKIDLVLNILNSPGALPIYEVAKTEGVRIV